MDIKSREPSMLTKFVFDLGKWKSEWKEEKKKEEERCTEEKERNMRHSHSGSIVSSF